MVIFHSYVSLPESIHLVFHPTLDHQPRRLIVVHLGRMGSNQNHPTSAGKWDNPNEMGLRNSDSEPLPGTVIQATSL